MNIFPFLSILFLAFWIVDVAYAENAAERNPSSQTSCYALIKQVEDMFTDFRNTGEIAPDPNITNTEIFYAVIDKCPSFTGTDKAYKDALDKARTRAEILLLAGSFPATEKTKIRDKILKCVTEIREGDSFLGLTKNITVGGAVIAKLFQYNLKTKKASVNAEGVGAGVTFRVYPNTSMTPFDDIRKITSDCRATTFDAKLLMEDLDKGKVAFPLISVTPAIFASKAADKSDVSVQPAILVGFFRDLINFGIGFNLAGAPRKDKGQVFVLVGMGYGFNF